MYRLIIIWSLFKANKIYCAPMKSSELFCFKDTKKFAALLFFLAACNKKFQRANATELISYRMKTVHPTIGWRRDKHRTHKHTHDSWILWSVPRVRSKAMHSLSCIMSWLPYITLCYIDSRFFLPLEQSRTALLAASRQPRKVAHWQ